ncbi:DUF4271 domain-containing protein [Thermaurantimonas aggregans]|uniref:DUF4271 domain-containing protein n=1 Tax=Thermaurantimonas aggregans TaxID=2173829 RepID=UPI0035311D45
MKLIYSAVKTKRKYFCGVEIVSKVQGDWFFYTIVLCIFLLVLQKNIWAKNVYFYLRILWIFNLKKVEDELDNVKFFNYFPLYINYIFVLTLAILLFFNFVIKAGGLALNEWSFLRLLLGLSVFLLTKNLLQQFVLAFFIQGNDSEFLNRNFELGNSFIGILAIPFLFISFYTLKYSLVLLWITLFVGLALYLYNLAKIAWYMYKFESLSPLFILVYLCSAEILPVFWITGWMSGKL